MADRFRPHGDLVDAVADATFERPPAIVCNAHITGVGVARSLSAAGVPVIAVDRNGEGVAPTSNAVDLAGRVTYPLEDPEGFRADVEAVAAACGADPVAFPCMDEWVHAFVDTRPDGVRLPFSTDLDVLLDKESLYGRAERLGVPYPETYRIEESTTDETRENDVETLPAAEAADRLGFPLVLKPALKRRFEAAFDTNVVEVGDPEQYDRLVERAAESGIRVLAQERVDVAAAEDRSLASYVPPGPGGCDVDYAVGTVGNAAVRYPPEYGTACVVQETADETVRERALSVIDDAGYHGISESEFVYDDRREEYVLLDVNTRPWKWIAMPVAAGYDLPVAAYAETTGAVEYDPVGDTPGANADRTTSWVYLRDYLATLSEDPPQAAKRALSAADWRALLDGSFEQREEIATAVYRRSDPDPAYRLVETELTGKQYYCAC